jgi:hypothetical protein
MKRTMIVTAAVGVLALVAGTAFAHMGGWMGPGMGPGGMMGGMMGPGMWRGGWGCPGYGPTAETPGLTEERARTLAEEYAKRYLPGYTVERVLPFTGRWHTMFQAELKGPGGETRLLHVNPWGHVMPFGGPVTR